MRLPYLLAFSVLFSLPPALHAQADSVALKALIQEFTSYRPYDSLNVWGMAGEEELEEQAAELGGFADRLGELTDLSAAQRIDAELLRFVLADRIYRLDFGTHRFPLNAEGGFLTDIVYRYGNRRVENEVELERYTAELAALPAYFRHQRAALSRGLAEGKTNPRRVVTLVLELIERTLAVPPAASVFHRPVVHYAPGGDRVDSLVSAVVYPAYRELADFLEEEYLPQLPAAPGVSSISGGREYYRHLIRYFTTDDEATPEAVFATGEREVARIRAEMEGVMERVGFAGSFAEFLDFLRSDPRFYAFTPEALLERAAWITKRIEGELPRYFDRLPRMPLTVTPVPAALAPNYTGGRYSPGSYAHRRAGAFWVNTYDLPSRPLYTLTALALHEGVPGHHTQMMLAAEGEGQSDFRKSLYLSAFGEGWALYAEYLGKEMGMYETAYDDFGRLTYEMWRACRLVVDPGIHYFGWSRERAVAYMAEHTALSLREVNTEIDRYIGWPGQAVSYKMGELKIRALRREAEERLGDRFDLAAFHRLVLANGAVTMEILEEVVRQWIASTSSDQD
ncbi:uncharacterized protein (DUF885 family) [Lewinella marina]|uniref:DUF885 domain-containing protein n=1 Tax=Neolewinella marina TaxID=438751 RepID=A0A2G0CDQ7_9BACT|nr:DUF885 domain-containing protein [Neolewinella marina]NJB85922.1 uncharacterized protein (DUF885 family) [Neolewinella marina]PHK98102.1 DUF885 domain-containing protein [Neolewinella marina]